MLVFILQNINDIPCMDLRMPQKIAAEIVSDPADWHDTALHLITHGDHNA
jgi:hypothetical protein